MWKKLSALGAGLMICLATSSASAEDDRLAHRRYDPMTEVTLTGVVVTLQAPSPAHGHPRGCVHLTMRQEDGRLWTVHLGPWWFLARLGIEANAGDPVEVLGSRTPIEGEETLIARSLILRKTPFVLRNQTGVPLWAGPRR